MAPDVFTYNVFTYKVAQFNNLLTRSQIDIFSDTTIEVYLPGGERRRLLDRADVLNDISREITNCFLLLGRFKGRQVLGEATAPVQAHYSLEYLSGDLVRACEIEVHPYPTDFPKVEGAYEALSEEIKRKKDLYFIDTHLLEVLRLIEKSAQEDTALGKEGKDIPSRAMHIHNIEKFIN